MNHTKMTLAAVAALMLSGAVLAQAPPAADPAAAAPRMQILRVQRGEGPGPMGGMGQQGGHGMMMGMPEGHPRMHGPGLRLVPMSPRLASYFGAKEGVLVVKADNPALKLEDGDVITAIGGRTPKSPMHALRIFHSYEPGEKVALQILRDHKAQTIEVTVPEHRPEMRRFELRRMEGPPGSPSAPPAPPAAPHQH